MKKTLSIFILSHLFSITLSAQSSKSGIDKQLEDVAYNLEVANDADKGLKILSQAKEASKSIGYKEGILRSEKILIFFHSRRGNYEKVIEISHEIEPLAMELKDNSTLSDLCRLRALSLGQLGLNDQSYQEFQEALKFTKKIEKENIRHYKTALLYENITSYFDHIKGSQDSILYYLKKSLQEGQKIEDNNPDVKLEYKYSLIATTNSNLGLFYMDYYEPQRMDLAEKYFIDALGVYNNKKYGMIGAEKVMLLTSLGRFYYIQKNYDEAIHYSTEAIELEKKTNSLYSRKDSYEILAKSYLELNNKYLSKRYTQLYTSLNDSLIATEKLSIKTPLNHIVSEKNKKHSENISMILISLGCIIVILVLAGWLFWKRQNRILHRKYKILIEKLKTEKNTATFIEEDIEKKKYNNASLLHKSFNITDETVDGLLLKLEKFENSKNLFKKEVSLTWLANHMNTNTRYLSEIIKQHKGKSFSDYMNGLRIKHIVELLYKEPKHRDYKISYLAELCGFSSREVFTIVFKKETGISPSYFINNLKNETDISIEEIAED